MRWVTRDHVHMDRVATPWLIKRFVDPDAEFLFVPSGKAAALPEGAIPFGLPGVELSQHDANGSTFRKIMKKYELADRALDRIADIIEAGIAHYFNKRDVKLATGKALAAAEGIGLEAISQGMLYLSASDEGNIERSAMIYDALYAFCRGASIEAETPAIAALPFTEKTAAIRARL